MSDAVPPPPTSTLVPAEPSPARISARTALILLVFTLFFTALMAYAYQATRPILAATAQEAKKRLIAEVLPASAYDNELLADAIELPPTSDLGLADSTSLYRARRDGQPVALVLETVALDGYSGEIRLILAIAADGRIIAARVTAHKETPGLGDYIEPRKDKNKASPWITQFDRRGFAETSREKWRVRKDGGSFDQRTGATITARAIVKATGRTLAWVEPRLPALFKQQADTRFEEKKP